MSERHPDANTLKKSLKAQVKLAKKNTGTAQTTDDPSASGSTPAERSAAAAEKQVRLQRWRVILALAGVGIGIATILLAMRPWEKDAETQPSHQTNTETLPTP